MDEDNFLRNDRRITLGFDFASAGSVMNDFVDSLYYMNRAGAYWTSPGQPKPETKTNNTRVTNKQPRAGYVDGGIVLAESFVITRKDFDEMTVDEWDQLKDFIEGMPNIAANEVVTDKVYHFYNEIPTITTMEA